MSELEEKQQIPDSHKYGAWSNTELILDPKL